MPYHSGVWKYYFYLRLLHPPELKFRTRCPTINVSRGGSPSTPLLKWKKKSPYPRLKKLPLKRRAKSLMGNALAWQAVLQIWWRVQEASHRHTIRWALEQMPMYAKFMKEILAHKQKTWDYETIAMTKKCSSIIQRKLPQKLNDPRGFTFPYAIGESVFERALCDLEASINPCRS